MHGRGWLPAYRVAVTGGLLALLLVAFWLTAGPAHAGVAPVSPPATVAADVPGDLGVYGEPVAYPVTTAYVTCAAPAYHVHIAGDEALAAGDVRLDYRDGGTWRALPLTAVAGELDGRAPAGSVTPATDFRIAVVGHVDTTDDEPALTLTTLQVATTVESAGSVCGDATDSDTVALHLPSITFTLPERVSTGHAAVFPVTVANPTGSPYEGIVVPVLTGLEEEDVVAGDVSLEYRDGDGFSPLPCAVVDGALVCDGVPGTELSIGSGDALRQDFRITVARGIRPQQVAVVMGLVQDSTDIPALATHLSIADVVSPAAARPRPNPPITATDAVLRTDRTVAQALPETGPSGILPTVLTGLLLLTLGTALVVMTSRRREPRR